MEPGEFAGSRFMRKILNSGDAGKHVIVVNVYSDKTPFDPV